MNNRMFALLLLIFGISCMQAQDVIVYSSYKELASDNFKINDTTYIINFWATWCGPCVKELPYFESFHQKNSDKKVKVILVSLDSKNQIKSHLLPFLKKNQYFAKTLALTDKDFNTWLPMVDEDWSGSIPATLIINGDNKKFAEREFESESDLSSFVFSFISSL